MPDGRAPCGGDRTVLVVFDVVGWRYKDLGIANGHYGRVMSEGSSEGSSERGKYEVASLRHSGAGRVTYVDQELGYLAHARLFSFRLALLSAV